MQPITLSNIFTSVVNKTYHTKEALVKSGLTQKFSAWLTAQEENRFLWMGIAIMGGIVTVLPLTLIAVVFLANNSFTLWAITLGFNVPVLIVNLAAQPPKITLPVLFAVWIIDAVIIAYCASVYFLA